MGCNVMITNHANVTIFCSKQVGREKIWIAKQICDVNLHSSEKLVTGDKEITHSDECIIRIPYASLGNDYVDSSVWTAASIGELLDKFTVKKGDYIVKGLVECNVTSSAEIIKNHEAYQVISVSANFCCSEFSKHIKLVVK